MTKPRNQLPPETYLNREQFAVAMEATPTGMLMVDESGQIVLVNAEVERLFGYHRSELVGEPVEMLVPAGFRHRHAGFREGFSARPQARLMGGGRDLYGLRKNGVEFPVEIGIHPVQTSEGFVVLTSIVDITERKRGEREREELLDQLRSMNVDLEERVKARTAELAATLKEREVLLQEVHHRVKNNLQVISSMINMQVRKLTEGASRDALEKCQTRVQAIALIHENLYQYKDYARVPFSEYVRSLTANILHAMGMSDSNITVELAVDAVPLPVDKAIPCGLVLNELIVNALKHAFPANQHGRLRVELRALDDGKMLLAVTDDGVGLPTTFDIERTRSLGMHLVSTLTEQLGGRLEIVRDKGTSIRITFNRSEDDAKK